VLKIARQALEKSVGFASLGIYTTVAVALIKKKSSHDRNDSYALTFQCNNYSIKTQS